MRKAREASVKKSVPETGMRKVWVTLAALGVLLLGLLLVMVLKQLSDGMWTAWCASVAGIGGVYSAANVVSKVIDKEK